MVQQSPESTCLILPFLQKSFIYRQNGAEGMSLPLERGGKTELAKSGRRPLSAPGAEITLLRTIFNVTARRRLFSNQELASLWFLPCKIPQLSEPCHLSHTSQCYHFCLSALGLLSGWVSIIRVKVWGWISMRGLFSTGIRKEKQH